MQTAFSKVMDEEFYTMLTGLISYLRRQQNLITEMKSQATKVADTRWESMGKASSWLVERRIRLRQYLAEKNPACTPSEQWWIVLIVVQVLSVEASRTFRSLQGLTLMINQQQETLKKLKWTYCDFISAQGPLDALEIASIDTDESILSAPNQQFSCSRQSVLDFILVCSVYNAMRLCTDDSVYAYRIKVPLFKIFFENCPLM